MIAHYQCMFWNTAEHHVLIFFVLQLYWIHLFFFFFLVETLELFVYNIMSCSNSDNFTSFFLSWIPFLAWLLVARTSNTTLSKSVKSVHPCCVPNLRGKAVSFSPLNLILAMGLAYMICIMLGYASSVLTLLRVFHHKCWSFSVAFSVSIDVIMSFILHLLIWCITLMDLQMLDHFSIPEVSSTWSWCIIFLMYCWIQFANILVSISYLCTLGVLAFNFLLVSLFW